MPKIIMVRLHLAKHVTVLLFLLFGFRESYGQMNFPPLPGAPPPPGQGFYGAFLYEPFPRYYSQLSIGCYTAYDDDFKPNPYFDNDEPPKFFLMAKQSQTLSFNDCWQFCMFKNPRSDIWFKTEFVGMRNDGSKCMCFQDLYTNYRPLAIAVCAATCTGVPDEFCQSNTMLVYLTCYPGFYQSPYCETTCPSGLCVRKEFPLSQYENYWLDMCTCTTGDCYVGCLDGTKTCPMYTESCRQIIADPNLAVVSKTPAFVITFPTTTPTDYASPTMDSFNGYQNLTLSTVTVNTVQTPWIRTIMYYTSAEGYTYMYTALRKETVNSDNFNIQIVSRLELKDVFGFSGIYKKTFGVGVMNEDNYKITTMGMGAFIGFGLDMYAANTSECQLFTNRGPGGYSANSYVTFSKGKKWAPNDKLQVFRVEPGTGPATSLKTLALMKSAAIATEVFVCGTGCAQKKCDCNGFCVMGCAAGLMGPTCQTPCPTGNFGTFCRYPCSPFCKNRICDGVTGICTLGCTNSSVQGAYCTEACLPGTYGDNCRQSCSANCINPLNCDVVTGVCVGGCKPGWLPPSCGSVCLSGTYGTGCQYKCGSCANGDVCDPVTGMCPNGCTGNKAQPNCLCPLGFFGDGCTKTCGSCAAGYICEGQTGACVPDATGVIKNATDLITRILSGSGIGIIPSGGLTVVSYQPGNTTNQPNVIVITTTTAATMSVSTTSTTTKSGATTSKAAIVPLPSIQTVAPNPPSARLQPMKPDVILPGQLVVRFNTSNGTVLLTPSAIANLPPSVGNPITGLISGLWTVQKPTPYDVTKLDPWTSLCFDPKKQSPQCFCDKNFYGDNCDMICGQCIGMQCNMPDGYCVGGCSAGYIQPYCTEKCPPGTYGDKCSKTCGYCSSGAACHNVNGGCLTGCVTGYKMPMCVVCADGYYDVNCTKKCGDCTGGAMCNYTTGYCTNGCSTPKEPPICVCPKGYWGTNCKTICGYCLNSTGCHAYTGQCLYGCQTGYTSVFCNQTCPAGSYGENCGTQCGSCKNRTICNPIDGTCAQGCDGNLRINKCKCVQNTWTEACLPCGNCVNGTVCNPATSLCDMGCAPGFKPPTCVCKLGTWSTDCSKVCGHCNNNDECDLYTGECTTGCAIGYQGKLCVDTCSWGFQGKNCSQVCGSCLGCKTCDPLTGFCLEGCKLGFFPPMCTISCPDQTYGALCKQLCGRCVQNQPCRKSDGKCVNGCMAAWQPPYCQAPCLDGFFGPNCLSTCGSCKKKEACNKVDGTCPQGCDPGYAPPQCTSSNSTATTKSTNTTGKAQKICAKGYYGDNCQQPCGHCANDNCDAESGLCFDSCDPGYMPMDCLRQCTSGLYGLGCAYKCGYCFDDNEICRHTDGLCRSGCKPGRYGVNCIFETVDELEAHLVASGCVQKGYLIELTAALLLTCWVLREGCINGMLSWM